MSAVFLRILNMSITASWLILAVIIARQLLRAAPRWTACLLWGMVALRLVCPFSLESTFSLIPSTETVPSGIAYQSRPSVNTGISIVNDMVNLAITASFTPNPGDSANPLQIIIPAIAAVWIAGMTVMLVYALISYLKLKKTVSAYVPAGENVFACDEKVVRDMNRDEMAAYSQTLLDCSLARKRIAACPLAFGEVGVKERVKCVLNYKKPAFWLIAVAVITSAGIAICFLTNPRNEGKNAGRLAEKDALAADAENQSGVFVPYAPTEDGEWEADGKRYKYCLVLNGRMRNAAVGSTFTVLSNDEDVTFEEVAEKLFSSQSHTAFDDKDAILVGLGTLPEDDTDEPK